IAAMRVVGLGYIDGWMGSVDPPKATRFLRSAADGGDAEAAFRLGEIAFTGFGRSRSEAEAEQWFVQAAERGWAEAKAMLGPWKLLAYDAGITDDYQPALTWLQRGAETSEPHAMHYLGMFYVEGGKRSGVYDPWQAVTLFRECAERTLFADCAYS